MLRISLRSALLLTSGLLAASPITAMAAVALDTPIDGDAIIVTGVVDGYRTVSTTSGTKTKTPIIDVPQAISVVTSEQISDQAIRSVADLTRLLPGVSAGQGEGHRDQLTLRGNNTTADFFVDGLRDDVQYFRSFYNIDRVEVHRGPNAMVFGRGGGGGVINRVTKSAIGNNSAVNAVASADSFGAWYLAGDANVGLGMAGIRFNAFYEELANHRNPFNGERFGINPTAALFLGDSARVEVGYEHVEDDRVVDRGVPAAAVGSLASPAGPLRGAEEIFFGREDVNRTRFNGDMLRYRGEIDLADGLKLTSQALYGDYDKIYSNIYAASPPDASNRVTVSNYRDLSLRRTLIGQANIEWRGETAGIGHVLLIGVEGTDQNSISERVNGLFAAEPGVSADRRTAQVALGNTSAIPAVTFAAGPATSGNRRSIGDLRLFSAYVQDQIKFGDQIELVAGVRYDRLTNRVTNDFTGATVARTDDVFSPRVGLVFKPVANASLYVSWARSFLPQSGDQFVSLDATTAALEPERFDNIEIGAKWDVLPDLSLAAAVYQLDRTNTRAAGPTPGTVVLTGTQRSRGVELSAVGKIMPGWQVSAGYAFTDAEITDTTTAAPAGRTLAQTPRHQLSLWNKVDVSGPLSVGLGLYHQSAQFASISNAVRIPAFTRLDAALFYTLTDTIELQVNVENLTDAAYFPTAHSDQNISIGAPFNARASVSIRF